MCSIHLASYLLGSPITSPYVLREERDLRAFRTLWATKHSETWTVVRATNHQVSRSGAKVAREEVADEPEELDGLCFNIIRPKFVSRDVADLEGLRSPKYSSGLAG